MKKNNVKVLGLLFATVFIFLLNESAFATAKPADFDGDGKTDITVTRENGANKDWYILKSSDFTIIATNFGLASDDLVPEDYDGDGKTDIAIYRVTSQGSQCGTPSAVLNQFWILPSSGIGLNFIELGCGPTLDPEKSQDFDGDGKVDPTIIDRYSVISSSDLVWNAKLSSTAYMTTLVERPLDTNSGAGDHKAIRGDFNGDGKADFGILDSTNSNAVFHIKLNTLNSSVASTQFGLSASDSAIPGDFDGDGKTDIAIYRSNPSQFWWIKSSDGTTGAVSFGIVGDLPVIGDYDGDNNTDPTITRVVGGGNNAPRYFHILGSTNGYTVVNFGLATDKTLSQLFSN